MRNRWSLRTWAQIALVSYVAFLLWVLLSPSGDNATAVVGSVTNVLTELGFSPGLVTGARVEFALNTLMFVPVSFLGCVALPRLNWRDWVAAAFVTSLAVEGVAALAFQDRSAQFVDVVANTLGAGLGAGRALTTALIRSGPPS